MLDAVPYKEQKEEIESEIVENDSQSGKNSDTQIKICKYDFEWIRLFIFQIAIFKK